MLFFFLAFPEKHFCIWTNRKPYQDSIRCLFAITYIFEKFRMFLLGLVKVGIWLHLSTYDRGCDLNTSLGKYLSLFATSSTCVEHNKLLSSNPHSLEVL